MTLEKQVHDLEVRFRKLELYIANEIKAKKILVDELEKINGINSIKKQA